MHKKLEEILEYKKHEVEARKQEFAIGQIQTDYSMTKRSLKDSLTRDLVAEFKRQSPSKGMINADAQVDVVVRGYEEAGASAVSVLTDAKYFAGSLEDLTVARKTTQLPILRKDFIVDEYQIYETKAYQADVVLLIARVLDVNSLNAFAQVAKQLNLEVLLEIHDITELNRIDLDLIDVLGVNNRDLDTFETNLDVSLEILSQLPKDICKISESGIHSVEDATRLLDAGFDGLLIGEQFMTNENPGLACKNFCEKLR